MRSFRPRLWMLLIVVALAALAAAGVARRLRWQRTTVIAEVEEISDPGGIPDPNDPTGGMKYRHLRQYADGHYEVVPEAK